MVNNRKSLVVYKASAGSGKTFTLATEYIKLLVINPLNYRTILLSPLPTRRQKR